jgi:hypothetical protein
VQQQQQQPHGCSMLLRQAGASGRTWAVMEEAMEATEAMPVVANQRWPSACAQLSLKQGQGARVRGGGEGGVCLGTGAAPGERGVDGWRTRPVPTRCRCTNGSLTSAWAHGSPGPSMRPKKGPPVRPGHTILSSVC